MDQKKRKDMFIRKLIKILIGGIAIAVGSLAIINYMMGFIPILNQSFLMCAFGVLITATGLVFLIPPIKRIKFPFFGTILTVIGIIELGSGFQAITQISGVADILIIAETLMGGVIFVIGMVLLGCAVLPFIIIGLSYLLKPILQFMRSMMVRNVIRNARRTQNTFAMISIGLAFLIAISTVIGSLAAGVYPGAKLSLGGDMRVGWTGGSMGYVPINFTNELRKVDHVISVVPMRQLPASNCIVDNYTTEYAIRFFVINTTEYAKIHAPPTLMDIKSPSGLSVSDFIGRLDQENGTIIYYELAEKLSKGVGDVINATSTEFTSVSLLIVGLCGKMPGIRYTYEEYSTPVYTVIISWNTFFAITGYNFTTFKTWVYIVVGLDDLSNDLQVKEQFTNIIESFRTVTSNDFQSVRNRVEEFSGIISTINVILNEVLFIALLVSLLGLSITMNISIRQRHGEIGIMRSIGISSRQILQLVFGETLTISLTGILFGSISGVIAAYLMISFFPFIEWIPVIFTISWTTLGIYWGILLGIALISSIIPAYNVNKLKIIEMIHRRDI